jgi:hypothetical protein
MPFLLLVRLDGQVSGGHFYAMADDGIGPGIGTGVGIDT